MKNIFFNLFFLFKMLRSNLTIVCIKRELYTYTIHYDIVYSVVIYKH